MVISHWWGQVAILTFIVGFVVLGIMAYKVYTQHPPVPEKVVSETGEVVFTGPDIFAGQQVFRKYGLMQHGTIFGHGAYLGPELHRRLPASGRPGHAGVLRGRSGDTGGPAEGLR
jgi:nitric oxide reductase subunit B